MKRFTCFQLFYTNSKCFILFLIFTLLVLSSNSTACTCSNVKSFWENFRNHYNENSIVQIVKIEDYYWGMKARVIEKQVTSNVKDTIMIWGINTMSCRWSRTSEYKNGDTLFYLLLQTDLEGNNASQGTSYPKNIENEEDYMLSSCSCNILLTKNKIVFGQITDNVLEMPKDTFYNLIKKPYINNIETSILHNSIDVYPNPASTSLTISKTIREDVMMKIYELNGKLLESRMLTDSQNTYYFQTNSNSQSLLFVFSTSKYRIVKKIIRR